MLPPLTAQGWKDGEDGCEKGWGPCLCREVVFSGGCLSPGRRGGLGSHLVIPCTGDELLRLREELYVLVPDGNSQVKPVIPYLVRWVDRGQGCGELHVPLPSALHHHPLKPTWSLVHSDLSLCGPETKPLPTPVTYILGSEHRLLRPL